MNWFAKNAVSGAVSGAVSLFRRQTIVSMRAHELAPPLVILAALCFPVAGANATKPCNPGTWFSNQERPGSEWVGLVEFVLVGRIVRIQHDPRPFANCMLTDRSACAQFNDAKIWLRVEKVEKGTFQSSDIIGLRAAHCAKPIPIDLDPAASYRFFFNGPQYEGRFFFETYEIAGDGFRGEARESGKR